MPIANCFIKEREIWISGLDSMAIEWAELIGADQKDICLNIITNFHQFGNQYSIMVNLYLPSLWSDSDVRRIQMGLVKVITKYLNISSDKIFIVTSIVQSGHVVENGEAVSWEDK